MLPLWSRHDVETRILAGETLVIRDDHVLRIPPRWLTDHPGGALAILHFVGRDAADELAAYHPDHTLRRIRSYAVARVPQPWSPLLPPVMSGWVRTPHAWVKEAAVAAAPPQILVKSDAPQAPAPSLTAIQPPPTSLDPVAQQQHIAAYRALHHRIKQAGLYRTPYLSGYGPELLRYILLAALSAAAYSQSYFFPSAVFLGLLWHQLTFTAHDLGHCGVTHNWLADRLLAILVTDLLGGISIGWWVDNHNIHHLVTNHPSHDPDIQHIPFFAISTAFLGNLYSSYYKRIMPFDAPAALLLSAQHRLFYLVMSLARFNLYANSFAFLLFRARRVWHWYLEVAALLAFWSWYASLLYGIGNWKSVFIYILVSHVVPSPLHVQIVLSHFSRSTADLGPHESFPHRQLRTTTDVVCPPSLAFLHGGLHLQVTHHLFPRLPRHNLRAASLMVKEYAKEQGLEYAEFGFVKGNQEVRGVLREVATQVRIVKMVAGAGVKDAIKAVQ
ncbi:delta 8-sphingoloid desaturase protein [Gautieria morchelliformis]|nr:delta 8-sphingoloid desaturase protein [Gautieria morchelliformis]